MSKHSITSLLKFVFTGKQDQYNADTLIEAIHFVFQNQKDYAAPVSLISFFLAFALWDKTDNTTVISWLIIAIFIRAFSYWQSSYFLQHQFSLEETKKWGYYFSVTTSAVGLLYGSAAILFFSPDLPVAVQLFILLLIIGSTNALIFTTAYWLASFYTLMFPALGMLIYALLIQEDFSYQLLAFLPFINMIIAFSMARKVQQSVLDSIQLRFEHSELLEKLKISHKEAEDANKRKARFLASASHDLRQPVHALSLFSEALSDESLSPRGRDTVAYMKDSVASLNDLLSSLLDISRLDAGIIQPSVPPFDISFLISRLANNMSKQAENKGLELQIHAPSVWVDSDSVMLESTLRNLIGNAIKYTHKGGVLIGCRIRKNEVWIEVWDTGIGIADSEKDYIFDEFYQVDNAERDHSRGLGLGLSIVAREMHILGHILSIHSRENCGTMVRIKVQRAIPSIQIPSEPLPTHNAIGRLVKKKVLVIDDEKSILVATTVLVEKWGCIVETAGNIDEALKACELFTPDVIISDFLLKDHITGIGVIEQLRTQLNQEVPAILITGDTAPDRLKQAQESGLSMLYKPVKPAKLRAAMNMVLLTTAY
ncbi:MAG: hybrid sensor histidine kinase/response regulator [Methyloprofundus sp.]|nr:hybrid sensor histidine kinase/response regulator [Methyloprofundus sp.]